MRKTVWIAVIVLVLSALVLAACGGGGASSGGSSGIKRQAVPAEFASATDPYAGQADAATAGKAIFDANCSTCHGPEGKGDGPAGASLNPKPANLELTAKETSVNYMHWVATVGGAEAGLSAQMPSFKGVLSDDDIWKVTTYLSQTYGKK